MSKLLDGKALSLSIQSQLASDIKTLQSQPGLDVILVGDNPASHSYVRQKHLACEKVGIHSRIHQLPSTATIADIEKQIDQCNNDSSVHGVLLQLPLPNDIQPDTLIDRIHPHKDVDGFHPENLGRLVARRPFLRPCTPYGVIQLLKANGIDLRGKQAVVVGASNIVGRPMALELLLAKSTVTVCHRFTKNLAALINEADILISATGNPTVIDANWIPDGCVVVDVGFNRDEKTGHIYGDIDFDIAKKCASYITPVPGGVGPMTVTTLLQNTLMAYKAIHRIL